MVRQYLEIKDRYADAILFFRLGDFYEMFFDDAVLASNILDITLTSRNKHDDNAIPLCGVPYHSVEPYIAKLLEHGKKVAICEQVEDPRQAKGVVKRAVTKIYTPGVIPDGATLDANSNNFVAAVLWDGKGGGIAYADISTGLFRASPVSSSEELIEELMRVEPREIITQSDADGERGLNERMMTLFPRIPQTLLENVQFTAERLAHLDGAASLLSDSPQAAAAAGAVYHYLCYTQQGEVSHVSRVERYVPGDAMWLDESTKRNLEILRTVQNGSVRGSLWWLMNHTRTSPGARLLKEWLCYPLTSKERIDGRLDAVGALRGASTVREGVRAELKEIADLERLSTRMSMGTGNAREMRAIARSLSRCASLKTMLEPFGGLISEIAGRIDGLEELCTEIEGTIADDPPLAVREGGMIRDGVDPELDDVRAVRSDAKQGLARIEADERARTGIGSLKVRYNKVFGYYIEITNAHRDKVPPAYIRKQTLSNAERYITEELKLFEEKVLGADDRIKSLEYELFASLRVKLAGQAEALSRTARAVAEADVLTSFAQIAEEHRYCRPTIAAENVLAVEEGRHPVVEHMQRDERFVPNDVHLGTDEQRFLMITGPNMAGKSTVMRQTALIVLMAQMGSFVPATAATVGVVDRIFTRIGASDALAKGHSTFMVEMMEAATILAEATSQSLIIIDEIGRGTSTFDGLAIAWSIAEELHDRVRARTLFATHYHELTELAVTRTGIKNFQIAVKEWNDEVIFLRRLVPGGTSHSYGIQVARLAGLPSGVIERSREILANLEQGEFDEIGRPRIAHRIAEPAQSAAQLALFTAHPVVENLRDTDLTTLTPLEALNLLHRWKQSI